MYDKLYERELDKIEAGVTKALGESAGKQARCQFERELTGALKATELNSLLSKPAGNRHERRKHDALQRRA